MRLSRAVRMVHGPESSVVRITERRWPRRVGMANFPACCSQGLFFKSLKKRYLGACERGAGAFAENAVGVFLLTRAGDSENYGSRKINFPPNLTFSIYPLGI